MPQVNIAKSSPTQLRKMKNGKLFRITGGHWTIIHLNDLQHKGLVRNSRAAKAYTVVYEAVQGAGIIEDLAVFDNPAAGLLPMREKQHETNVTQSGHAAVF